MLIKFGAPCEQNFFACGFIVVKVEWKIKSLPSAEDNGESY